MKNILIIEQSKELLDGILRLNPTTPRNEDMGDDLILQRYQELVDAKFTRGLTAVEEAEIEQLEREVDRMAVRYYQPSAERLRRIAEEDAGN